MFAAGYDFLPPTSYSDVSKTTLLSPHSGGTLTLGEVTMNNRSGGIADLAFGYKVPLAWWVAGSITNANNPKFLDATGAAQSAAANDFPLFTTTNNDGFLVQSLYPFNLIGITVGTTVQTGAPTYTYTYFNGTSMVAIPSIINTPVYTASADTYLSFLAPQDWVKGTSGTIGGSQTMYTIQALATTAPTIAPIASVLWLGSWVAHQPQIANNNGFSFDIPGYEWNLIGGSSLMPFFSVANANNEVQAHYRTIGSLSPS